MDCGVEWKGAVTDFLPRLCVVLMFITGIESKLGQALVSEALPAQCLEVLGCPKRAEAA